MRRKKPLAVVVSVLSAVMMLLSITPASAAVIASSFRNFRDGTCLDFRQDRGVYAITCNGGNYQKWIWNTHNAPTPIKQVATDKCLEVHPASGVLTAGDCDTSREPGQWWLVTPHGGGQIPFLKNNLKKHCVLTVGGSDVEIDVCREDHGEMRWRIIQ